MNEVEVVNKVQEIGGGLADRVQAVLGTIAEKLGQGVEHFWPVFVKQQLVESIFYLFAIIAGAVLTVTGLKLGYRLFNEGEWGNESGDPDIKRLLGILCLIAGCVLVIVEIIATSHCGLDIITGLINPEYAAVQDVVRMVVPVK